MKAQLSDALARADTATAAAEAAAAAITLRGSNGGAFPSAAGGLTTLSGMATVAVDGKGSKPQTPGADGVSRISRQSSGNGDGDWGGLRVGLGLSHPGSYADLRG